MTDLTPEKRAQLRHYAEVVQAADYETTLLVHYTEMLALLDAAEERDRLLTVADTLGRINGEYAMEIRRCREALGVDEDTDPHHAAQALAAAVERVRELHAPSPVFMCADECGHDPEDHDETESITGDVLCWDSPTGEFYCTACGGDPIDELPAHPCATIRALDGTDE